MANSNITKKALAQSLKELGSTKILDKITVADITNHCGVNRQTFYYHFNDKYELLNWIYTEDLFKPLTKDLDFFNWGDKLVGLLKYMKNMKPFFMNTIKSSNNFFAEYMDKVLIELMHKAIKDLDLYNHLGEKEKDIYARYDGKNTKANNYDNGSVKLFGFRSGAVYKMVPAILYYAFMIFYIGTGIYGELSYYKFEPMDYVITILKYIFFIVWFFSPAIFLSNFKYRDSLPLFKKHDAGSSIIGIIIISLFCSFMTMVYKECMSDTYKKSVRAYDSYLKEQREKKQQNTEPESVSFNGITYDVNNNKVYLGEA